MTAPFRVGSRVRINNRYYEDLPTVSRDNRNFGTVSSVEVWNPSSEMGGSCIVDWDLPGMRNKWHINFIYLEDESVTNWEEVLIG